MVWGRNPGILKCDSAKTQYFMGDFVWYFKVKCLSANFILPCKWEIPVLLALVKEKGCKAGSWLENCSEDCFSFTNATQNEATLVKGKREPCERKSQWLDRVVVQFVHFPSKFLRNQCNWWVMFYWIGLFRLSVEQSEKWRCVSASCMLQLQFIVRLGLTACQMKTGEMAEA